MNYHDEEWIMNRLNEHLLEAQSDKKFNLTDGQIVGIFVQGSQNYELDYEDSDLDTKLIITPTLDDLIYNRKPISTTRMRFNEEHTDIKDIRLYMDTFKKQNLNFLEILFTPYAIINPAYEPFWNQLKKQRELIAHMDNHRAVKSMQGIAMNKYCALEHEYEGKLTILHKYGYDPKQLHHLLRIKEFLQRYIDGESYADCLVSKQTDYLIDIKKGILPHEEAKKLAEDTMFEVDSIANEYYNSTQHHISETAEETLNAVQYQIMYKSIYDSIAERSKSNEKADVGEVHRESKAE